MGQLMNPTAEAETARLALRDLKTAVTTLDDPRDTYQVLASLSDAMRSLRTVVDGLALLHQRIAPTANDAMGDGPSGLSAALAAAEALRDSARQVDYAWSSLDRASVLTDQLTWPPSPPPGPTAPVPTRLAAPPTIGPDVLGAAVTRRPVPGPARDGLSRWFRSPRPVSLQTPPHPLYTVRSYWAV